MEQFSCTISISEKPDWEKICKEIIDSFLAPLSNMIETHGVGRLTWVFYNKPDCILMVSFHERQDGNQKTIHYYASLHTNTTVVVGVEGGMGMHPNRYFSLKAFLTYLAEIFGKRLAERAAQYAEVAALGEVMEATRIKLASIKATAHYE